MAEDNKIKIKYTAHDIAETQLKDFSKNHSADNFEDHIVKKYFILSEKLLSRGRKYIDTVNALKGIAIAFFLIFTGFTIYMGHSHGSKMLWFSIWIALIFVFVFVFVVLDYFKNVFLRNLTDFIEDVEETEFKEINFDDYAEEEDEDENNSENIQA